MNALIRGAGTRLATGSLAVYTGNGTTQGVVNGAGGIGVTAACAVLLTSFAAMSPAAALAAPIFKDALRLINGRLGVVAVVMVFPWLRSVTRHSTPHLHGTPQHLDTSFSVVDSLCNTLKSYLLCMEIDAQRQVFDAAPFVWCTGVY